MKTVETGIPALKEYERAVDTELMPALETTRMLVPMANWGSRPIFNFVIENEIVWKEACRLSRGERPYPTFEGTVAFLKSKIRLGYVRLQMPTLRK
jgi:hypothetical protein